MHEIVIPEGGLVPTGGLVPAQKFSHIQPLMPWYYLRLVAPNCGGEVSLRARQSLSFDAMD
jgi:hypothetical protein